MPLTFPSRPIGRALGFVARLGYVVLARVQLRGCRLGPWVNTTGRVVAIGGRGIRLDEHVRVLGGLVPTRFVAHPDAQVNVGARSVFNYGVTLEAHQRIDIGRRCMFGSGAIVRDRVGDHCAPITIDDEVWLAHGAEVRPGVHIGRRAVVSAGSVVTRDVPPETLAVGNPARMLPLRLLAGGEVSGGEGP